MPKYRFAYYVGYRKPKSLGTMTFADDDAALAAFAALDLQAIAAELWRPDQGRLLASMDSDGVVTLPEAKP